METTALERGNSPAYPLRLDRLHDPPATLFARGDALDVLEAPMVAVVGARACTPYARSVATSAGEALAGAGFVVVSGLAVGVDSAAHRGALAAGGKTVAVLGSGADVIYPTTNECLASEIGERGLLVSEYPDGTPPAPWRFPARNRIIAGLSLATVVVEGRKGSGALITADFALEIGCEVFAVPGQITSNRAAGTNDLIRNGATPVTSVAELLADLGVDGAATSAVALARRRLSRDEARLLDAIEAGAETLDDLGRELDLDQASLASGITALELAGVVEEDDGLYRPAVV